MQTASATHLESTVNQSIATKDIKLLVLDIDGTIAGHSNTMSEPVKQAILQRKHEEFKWRSLLVECIVQLCAFTKTLALPYH